MKMILLSDAHMVDENPQGRLDDLAGETQWTKLRFMLDYALSNGIGTILQAGDLTDVKRSWALLLQMIYVLSSYPKIKIYTVKGQHDSYYRNNTNDKTIMGVLASAGLVKLLGSDPISVPGYCNLYGASYGEGVPVPDPDTRNILVLHRQIIDAPLWKGQTDYDDATEFLKIHKNYGIILCGDAHKYFVKQIKGRIICNTGPMLRLESSQAMINHKPLFFVLDVWQNKLETVYFPAQSGSSVLSRVHLETKEEKKISFEDFIYRVKNVSRDKDHIDFDSTLNRLIKENKTQKVVVDLIRTYLSKAEQTQS